MIQKLYSKLYKKYTFLTKIPFFNAKFNVIITTDGTANPNAQGHDATKIEIALSNGKHHTQYSRISTRSNAIKIIQTNKTKIATIITPKTNFYESDYNIADIPNVLSSRSDYAKFNYSAI